MIYLYVGLGMAMLLPIMVGVQMAVSVPELEQGELSFQREGGKILRDWEDQLCLKADPNAACNNARTPKAMLYVHLQLAMRINSALFQINRLKNVCRSTGLTND